MTRLRCTPRRLVRGGQRPGGALLGHRLGLQGLLALGDREPALVERLAGDHAAEVDLAQVAQAAQVVERADAARVQKAPADDLGDLPDALEVDAAEHAVAVDVGVDERAHAAVLQPLDDGVGRHLRDFLPARRRDVAAARVDRHDHAVAERAEDVVEEVDVGERGGAEDHALGAGPQRVAAGGQRAKAAAVLDGDVQLVGDPLEVLERLRRARARAVEVDDVQEAGAGLDPGAGGLQRRVLVDGDLLEVALDQPDGLAVADVDRRVEDHAAATWVCAQARTKFASRAMPSREDFSGWNCVPWTLPRPTTLANSTP